MNIENQANSNEPTMKYIQDLTENILKEHGRVDGLIKKYRSLLGQIETKFGAEGGNSPERFWVYAIHCDALVRLRIFLESNFNYIETLGLVTLTRYIFELTIWLKLTQKNREYSLLYKRELIKNQLNHSPYAER